MGPRCPLVTISFSVISTVNHNNEYRSDGTDVVAVKNSVSSSSSSSSSFIVRFPCYDNPCLSVKYLYASHSPISTQVTTAIHPSRVDIIEYQLQLWSRYELSRDFQQQSLRVTTQVRLIRPLDAPQTVFKIQLSIWAALGSLTIC